MTHLTTTYKRQTKLNITHEALPINQIICGDCIEVMKTFPNLSIDLVVTSPPYNVGKDYGYGRKKDKVPFDCYYKFAFETVKEIERVLVIGGRFCIEIGGSGRCFPLSWTWQDAAFKNGLKLFSEIVIPHRKTNPTAWGSWLKPDNVYTIPNFHMAYIFFKGSQTKNGQNTDIQKTEFVEWTRGHWKINYAGRQTNHPSEFPEELPKRFLKLFGHIDDIILDPFVGSGTTCMAAEKLGRKWVGIDINPEYVEMAKKRIANVPEKLSKFLEEASPK